MPDGRRIWLTFIELKMKTIDMSEEAVWRRLRQVDQLHELCLSLAKAKLLTKEEATELRARIRAEKKRSDSGSPEQTF